MSQLQACLMDRSTFPSCCLARTQSASSASPGDFIHLHHLKTHQDCGHLCSGLPVPLPGMPRTYHHTSGWSGCPAAQLPCQPAAGPDGQAEKGGGAQVRLTPKPGPHHRQLRLNTLWQKSSHFWFKIKVSDGWFVSFKSGGAESICNCVFKSFQGQGYLSFYDSHRSLHRVIPARRSRNEITSLTMIRSAFVFHFTVDDDDLIRNFCFVNRATQYSVPSAPVEAMLRLISLTGDWSSESAWGWWWSNFIIQYFTFGLLARHKTFTFYAKVWNSDIINCRDYNEIWWKTFLPMMITVRTMILMDGRFEGRRDSDDGDDNFAKLWHWFWFLFSQTRENQFWRW